MLAAILIGGGLAVILESIFHAIAPTFAATNYQISGQDTMDNVIGLVPLHAPFRDGLQLFLLMHGIAVRLQYVTGSSTYTYGYNPILNGLLFIPALALTLGGYIAACSDLQNHPARSLLRGAAIGIPYAVALLLLVSQVNGAVPTLYPGSNQSDTYTLTIDPTSLFFLALLWGTIFGVLGASIKLGRGKWRGMVSQALGNYRRPQVVGMILGGLSASGMGLALSFLMLCSMLALTAFSVPIFTQNLCIYNYGHGDWQYMTAWVIAQGPLHAANLFFYSFGAPLTINNPKEILNPCFYTSSPHVTLSMFGGAPHLPSWTYALLLLPLLSLFLGGRVSASYGRAQTVGQGIVQGALIALPFALLMMLLSAFTMLAYQYSGQYSSSSSTSIFTQSFGVGAFDLLLWALLSGGVWGALGGAYQVSALKPRASAVLAKLTLPLYKLGTPVYAIVDRVRGHSPVAQRTPALRLLYGAVFAALILFIGAGIAALSFIIFSSMLPYSVNNRVRDILAVVLVALPGLLLMSAGAAALAEMKAPPLIRANVPVGPIAPPPSFGMPGPNTYPTHM